MEILGAALAGFGTTTVCVILIFALVNRNNGLSDRLIAAADDRATGAIHAKDLEQAVADRDKALAQAQQQCEAESRARAAAEKHRDDLLMALAAAGDPGAVAAGINDELRRLSKLSGAAAPAATEGGAGAGAVHVPAASDGSPGVAEPKG